MGDGTKNGIEMHTAYRLFRLKRRWTQLYDLLLASKCIQFKHYATAVAKFIN